jgi:hypothetical protein
LPIFWPPTSVSTVAVRRTAGVCPAVDPCFVGVLAQALDRLQSLAFLVCSRVVHDLRGRVQVHGVLPRHSQEIGHDIRREVSRDIPDEVAFPLLDDLIDDLVRDRLDMGPQLTHRGGRQFHPMN